MNQQLKQLLWNSVKLVWVMVATVGYWLHFTDRLDARLTTLWVTLSSLSLAAVYSFLSAYRLGPSKELGEFLPKSEIAEFNPNQWLFGAWLLLSLGIALPAYHYRPAWVIIAPSLLAGALLLTIGLLAVLGRSYHRMVRRSNL